MSKYSVNKVFDGFSTCFRQWRADTTHCKFLHGYDISFDVKFGCTELDERNWVWDFGGMKRAKSKIELMNPDEWLKHMFDHTTIVAADDPELSIFRLLDEKGILKLRILPSVGCEKFAEYVYNKLNDFLKEETNGRAFVISVKCSEHFKNSATYGKDSSFALQQMKQALEAKETVSNEQIEDAIKSTGLESIFNNLFIEFKLQIENEVRHINDSYSLLIHSNLQEKALLHEDISTLYNQVKLQSLPDTIKCEEDGYYAFFKGKWNQIGYEDIKWDFYHEDGEGTWVKTTNFDWESKLNYKPTESVGEVFDDSDLPF